MNSSLGGFTSLSMADLIGGETCFFTCARCCCCCCCGGDRRSMDDDEDVVGLDTGRLLLVVVAYFLT